MNMNAQRSTFNSQVLNTGRGKRLLARRGLLCNRLVTGVFEGHAFLVKRGAESRESTVLLGLFAVFRKKSQQHS